jgi:eukaryotic-like serine/threonine-protein kinase
MASAFDKQSSLPAQPSMSGPRTTAIEPFTMPFQPGEVIVGKYKVIRLIGTGGVGFVVSARHVGFDELVALKFLRPEFATHAEAVTRFTIEARASFKIKSEHVARVLDVDTLIDGTPFIAMELLEGTDLRSLLDRCRMLAIPPAVDYALQTCEALAAAHSLRVIHRDIKPENLFLTGPGDETDRIKVLDFGISKVALTGTGRHTNQALTRIAVGTPPYMSPEQVRASSDLDARSDIWSLGCVLYELITGTAPFDRMSLMQSCAAVLEEQPAPPRDLRPGVSHELDAVVMRCLEKHPDARFQNVAELAEALAPFGSGQLATYSDRCRAFLNGDGLGRRSTPNALPPVPRRPSLPPSLSESSVHRRQTGMPARYPTGMPARYPTSSRPAPPYPTGAMPRPPSVMPPPPGWLPGISRHTTHAPVLRQPTYSGSSAQPTASLTVRQSTAGYSRLPTGVGAPGPLSSNISIVLDRESASQLMSTMASSSEYDRATRPTVQFNVVGEVAATTVMPTRWPWALAVGAALAFATAYVLAHTGPQAPAPHVATAAPASSPVADQPLNQPSQAELPQPIAASPIAAPPATPNLLAEEVRAPEPAAAAPSTPKALEASVSKPKAPPRAATRKPASSVPHVAPDEIDVGY